MLLIVIHYMHICGIFLISLNCMHLASYNHIISIILKLVGWSCPDVLMTLPQFSWSHLDLVPPMNYPTAPPAHCSHVPLQVRFIQSLPNKVQNSHVTKIETLSVQTILQNSDRWVWYGKFLSWLDHVMKELSSDDYTRWEIQ